MSPSPSDRAGNRNRACLLPALAAGPTACAVGPASTPLAPIGRAAASFLRRQRSGGRGALTGEPSIVREHDAARLIVHLGLERMAILERDGALRRRPGADLVDQALEIGKAAGNLLAQHHRSDPGP